MNNWWCAWVQVGSVIGLDLGLSLVPNSRFVGGDGVRLFFTEKNSVVLLWACWALFPFLSFNWTDTFWTFCVFLTLHLKNLLLESGLHESDRWSAGAEFQTGSGWRWFKCWGIFQRCVVMLLLLWVMVKLPRLNDVSSEKAFLQWFIHILSLWERLFERWMMCSFIITFEMFHG